MASITLTMWARKNMVLVGFATHYIGDKENNKATSGETKKVPRTWCWRVHRYNSHCVLIMGVVFLVLCPEFIFQNGIPHVFMGMIAPNDAQQLPFLIAMSHVCNRLHFRCNYFDSLLIEVALGHGAHFSFLIRGVPFRAEAILKIIRYMPIQWRDWGLSCMQLITYLDYWQSQKVVRPPGRLDPGPSTPGACAMSIV